VSQTIDFKFGSLIRTGPKLANGGKWDAELIEWRRNATTNADLVINIRVYFEKIDPAHGSRGQYPDSDTGAVVDPKTGALGPLKTIIAWKPQEFDRFATRTLTSAQRFWSGVFWLKTPTSYRGLDWPEKAATHRCNVYCKLELGRARSALDAHYTIAVVRVPDSEFFRSNSRLYSQKDIRSEQMIPGSTRKFFTHFHEVGHLLGLGHIGWHGNRNLHGNNDPKAYGVTLHDMSDVMGRGAAIRHWHATPWREAVATFTNTEMKQWTVALREHITPARL
jgi:hypothetical protein